MMTSFLVAEILKKASEVTQKINLLVDSSKFMRVGAFSVMPLSDVDRIVTDKKIDSRLVEKCKDLGIEMIV
jgi:DeoR/GlpR family transcriptional regulator of sugar metabolism